MEIEIEELNLGNWHMEFESLNKSYTLVSPVRYYESHDADSLRNS